MASNTQVIRIIHLLKKSILPILIISCLFSSIAFFYTKSFIKPQYKATTQLVGQSEYSEVGDVNKANFQLLMVNTYKGLTKSTVILNEAKTNLLQNEGRRYSLEQIQNMLSVDGDENSQIFSVSAIDTNPTCAKQVAQEVGNALASKVSELLGKGAKLSVISTAEVNYTPESPNIRLNTMLGFLFGMLVAVGIIYIKDLQSLTLKEFDSIGEELGLRNLGNIGNQSRYIRQNKQTNFHSDTRVSRKKKRKRRQ